MMGKMTRRRVVGVLMSLMLAAPAAAQLIDIGKFKGVVIPYNLKFKDEVLEKGRYDLETLKNPDNPTCYLRFKKAGKVICLVEGERLWDASRAGDWLASADYPDNPQLKMKKNPEEKTLIFTVMTGRRSLFPFLKLQFKLEYVE